MKYDQLIDSIRELDSSLKNHAKQAANMGLTLRNWIVGAYIIDFELDGEQRAKYGDQLMITLAKSLNIKGLNPRSLADCRLLALSYPNILQTLSAKSESPILQTVSAILKNTRLSVEKLSLPDARISQTASVDSDLRPDFAPPFLQLSQQLSFSHFVELLRLKEPLKRVFYEIECTKANWSVRELKRQIGSLLYERLGLSTDKEKLMRITAEKIDTTQPADHIKDPYIFEFLGLQPKEALREADLETALLDNLQEFLLELGNGFCFEDRQKRIRIGRSDYFADIVFYHRKLHCHVIVELKTEPFSYENIGQLNTYLSHYRKHEMQEGDNPPIGILLCTDKDQTLVEYALGGMDENLFVSSYQVALPSKEELAQFVSDLSK